MEKKMRWIALALVFLFVLAPVQINADEMDEPSVADVTEPEVTEPEATEPEATEPEATEPEATEPEATEPEATEPEATEPEATEPEATEPTEEPVNKDFFYWVNIVWTVIYGIITWIGKGFEFLAGLFVGQAG